MPGCSRVASTRASRISRLARSPSLPARSGTSAPSRNLSSALSERNFILHPSRMRHALRDEILLRSRTVRADGRALSFGTRGAPTPAHWSHQSKKFHSLSTAAHKSFSRCPRGRTLRKDETCECVRAARMIRASPRRPEQRGCAPILFRRTLRGIPARRSLRDRSPLLPVLLPQRQNRERRAGHFLHASGAARLCLHSLQNYPRKRAGTFASCSCLNRICRATLSPITPHPSPP